MWSDKEQKRWEVTVENQRHFNGLIMQSRVLGKSIIVTFMAVAAAFTLEKNAYLWAGGVQFFVLMLSIGIWILDTYYWSLLIAAVEYGEELEKKSGLPTVRIGNIEAYGLTHYIHKRVEERNAARKQKIFYSIFLSIQVVLVILYLGLGLSGY
jgi:hypothetical protein